MSRLVPLSLAALVASPAAAGEVIQQAVIGNGSVVYEGGGYEVKEKRRPGSYKYELKGPGIEIKRKARADGSWKEEIKDGACEIERKMTADGRYSEERDCD